LLDYGPYVEAISVSKIVKATMEDSTLNKLAKHIRIGYIDKKAADLKPYVKIFEQLTISESGIILKENQNTPPRETHYKSYRESPSGRTPRNVLYETKDQIALLLSQNERSH